MTLADQKQRELALDVARSFIVQAPAGSGKTELLIQRYLVLLAQAQRAPEEILAITFTRKAASEMHGRVLNALLMAQTGASGEAYQHTTLQLAQKALKHAQEAGWDLINNPNRLRIQTIDALCSRITLQMPILSQFGFQPDISEDPQHLYELAVREVLASLDSDPPWKEALVNFLLYLDNDHGKAQRLLVGMLGRRDQWLPHILMPENPRVMLEAALGEVIAEQVQKIAQIFPRACWDELQSLMAFAEAGGNRVLKGGAQACADPMFLLDSHVRGNDGEGCLGNDGSLGRNNLEHWLKIANFLLKKDREWRRQFTAREGFPAVSSAKNATEKALYSEMKARVQALVEQLQTNNSLHQELQALLDLPPPNYTSAQWQMVQALLEILPIAVAMLNTLFKEHGTVDYIEIAMKALDALGNLEWNLENPNDLAMVLDHQIRHILVDEFQDTSVTQYRLLERLTADWQAQEARSLFLVGDPMQSIYRFRKAEVGLFLQAKYQGLGHMKLEPLTLSVNFRSRPAIVNWLNETFAQIFPESDDLATGAIKFTSSTSVMDSLGTSMCLAPRAALRAVQIGYPADLSRFRGNDVDEAENRENDASGLYFHTLTEDFQQSGAVIAKVIQQARDCDPSQSIAILVLARNHLLEILPLLRAQNIPYRAVEIETLAHRSVIQDLLALTRALTHVGDRIAWLAVLRAPWCGLSLADLTFIAEEDFVKPIWQRLLELSQEIELEMPLTPKQLNPEQLNPEQLTSEQREYSDSGFLQCESHQSESQLSQAGSAILRRVIPILARSLAERQRGALAQWIEATWLALGGPACVEKETELADAAVFFDLLTELENKGNLADISDLEQRLQTKFAAPIATQACPVEVMTIHKAKGLEFDTVILPALERQTRHDDHQLLAWEERPLASKTALLFAPIKTHEENAIYDYLRKQENKRSAHEMARLLYVATSRAKQQLHLLTHVVRDDSEFGLKRPHPSSFLDKLWGPCHKDFKAAMYKMDMLASAQDAEKPLVINRLVPEWENPVGTHFESSAQLKENSSLDLDSRFRGNDVNVCGNDVRKSLESPISVIPAKAGQIGRIADLHRAKRGPKGEVHGRVECIQIKRSQDRGTKIRKLMQPPETLRIVGIICHRLFRQLSLQGLVILDPSTITQKQTYFRSLLTQYQLNSAETERAVALISQVISNTLNDERGQWLLKHDHFESQAELALTVFAEGVIQHKILDRTFVDQEKRWIVDYKIVETHAAINLEEFLAREKKLHGEQLLAYAKAMQNLDERFPIHLGLYFPLQQAWCEWQFQASAQGKRV